MREHDTVSDADAVRQVLSGRRDDFAVLVRRYLPAMQALAYSATGSHPDAEDIAQESFLQAFRHLDRLREPARFGAWLATIVKNTARSLLRSRGVPEQSLETVAELGGSVPPVEQREIHAFLRREIGHLDGMYRDVLLLHYFAGLGTNEIANLLNISQSAVLKRLERGRNALGERLVTALGQDLRIQGQQANQKAPQIMGLVMAMKVPWKIAAEPVGTTPVSRTLAQKAWSAISQYKVAALAGVSLTAVCSAFLVRGWIGTASAIDPPTQSVSEVASVVEPAATPETASSLSEASAGTMTVAAVEPASSEQEDSQKPAPAEASGLPARNEAPMGYPGQDFAGARRHVVEGAVFDPQKNPLPGSRVWVARAGWGAPNTHETTSDEQGQFRFDIPDGKWKVLAAKETLGGEADIGPSGMFVVEGTPKKVTTSVWTEERSLIRGQLLDERTGKPLPSGMVFEENQQLPVKVDTAGRFIIEGLRPQDHTFVAVSPGHARQYVVCSTALKKVAALEVSMKPGGEITGTVTDSAGRPVAHAWVRRLTSGSGCLNAYYEVCDDQGRFEYDGAPLDREFRIEARWPLYINACYAPEPALVEWKGSVPGTVRRQELKLVLPEGLAKEAPGSFLQPEIASSVICGRVVNPNGEPVRNFVVRLGLPHPSVARTGLTAHYLYPGMLFTSDDGTFAVTGDGARAQEAQMAMPPQMQVTKPPEVRLTVSADGYRDAVIERVAFKPLASSGPSDKITLRLGEMTSLEVHVREEGGSRQPLDGACVTLAEPFWDVKREGLRLDHLEDSTNRPRQAWTDARGIALFKEVASVNGAVRVVRDGYAMAGTAWDGSTPSVALALEPECILKGEVLDEASGQPVNGHCFIVLHGSQDGSYDPNEEGAAHREYNVFPEDGGKFRIAGLPPRRYELHVTCYGGASESFLMGNAPGEIAVSASQKGPGSTGSDGSGLKHVYNDIFTLEAGQTLEVSYPRDDIRQNPERLAALEAEVPVDVAVHKQLIGVWTRRRTLEELGVARKCVEIWCFEEQDKYANIAFVGQGARDRAPYTQIIAGRFNVVDGLVHFYPDFQALDPSWWPVPVEFEGDEMRRDGGAGGVDATYTRQPEGLGRALEEAEAFTGASLERDFAPLEERVW